MTPRRLVAWATLAARRRAQDLALLMQAIHDTKKAAEALNPFLGD